MKKKIFLGLVACFAWTYAAAESVEGVLEKGSPYSALFTFSPESGDMIGYAFKNPSRAGKSILENCLPGMLCKIEKAGTRDIENTEALNFADSPSGWYEITHTKNVYMESAVHGYEKTAKTRYGTVSVREDDNVLLYKGKPVSPEIQGNSSLNIVASYEAGKNDILLLQDTGGTACPALFRFVTLGPKGLSTTPEFGTCSDIAYPTFDEKTGITVAMTGFLGPFEPEAQQKKAYMTKHVYRLRMDGVLVGNGKIVR